MRGTNIWVVGTILVIAATAAAITVPIVVPTIFAIIIALSVRRHPRFALTLWMAVTYFVPFWTVIPIGFTDLTPPTLGAILILPTILTHLQSRMIFLDWVMIVFTALVGAAVFFTNTSPAELASIITQWIPVYFIGRCVAPAAGLAWTAKLIAVFTGIIGLWSIVEFVFHWHVFANYLGTSKYTWESIQTRGPWERSEAAFGHSIALGAFLVIGTPFIMAAPLRTRTRFLLLAITVGGVFFTFSRAGQVAVALAIVLCIVFLRQQNTAVSRNRIGWGLVTTFALALAVPFVLSKFAEVSSDTGPSTAYRVDLLNNLGDLNPLGPADYYVLDTILGTRVYRGHFGSIDNTPLLLALSDGWLPVVALCVPLIGAFFLLLRGRASVATIAIFAALPVLLTASLITQWVAGFAFLLGLAAAYEAAHKDSAAERAKDPLELREEPKGVSIYAV